MHVLGCSPCLLRRTELIQPLKPRLEDRWHPKESLIIHWDGRVTGYIGLSRTPHHILRLLPPGSRQLRKDCSLWLVSVRPQCL